MGAAAHLKEVFDIEGLDSHELALADKGSLRSACGGQEGRRPGQRGASMQAGWACEVGGACSARLLRVRMRAAGLAPLAGVASATETRKTWAGASILGGVLASVVRFGVAIYFLFHPKKEHLPVT